MGRDDKEDEWSMELADQLRRELRGWKMFPEAGKLILTGHNEGVNTLAVSNNNEWIASGEDGEKVVISNMKGEVINTVNVENSAAIPWLEFTSDSEKLFVGIFRSAYIDIYDTKDWSKTNRITLPNPLYGCINVKITQNGKYCIVSGSQHAIFYRPIMYICNLSTIDSPVIEPVPQFEDGAVRLCFHPNEECFLAGNHDGSISIYSFPVVTLLKHVKENCHGKDIFSLKFSNNDNGKHLVTGSQ